MAKLYILRCAIIALLLTSPACSNDEDVVNDDVGGASGASANAGHGASAAGASGTGHDNDRPPPTEDAACMLALDASSASDVEAALGEPSSQSRANGTLTLDYTFRDGSMWTFGFNAQGVWNNISVVGATSYPSCWVPDGGWFERPDGGWYERPDGGWSSWRD